MILVTSSGYGQLALAAACLAFVQCESKPKDPPPASSVTTPTAKTENAAPSLPESKAPVPPSTDPTQDKENPDQDFAIKGYCETTIEGAIQAKSKVPGGKMTFGSDYFMNDEELRNAVSMMSAPDQVDKAMAKDPKLYIFILNCEAGDVSLSIGPFPKYKYSDIPFGPGKYKMGRDQKISALIASRSGENYKVDDGEFEFTSFDKNGAKGTYKIAATGMKGGKITVNGKFDLACPFDTKMCIESRQK